MNTCKNCAYRAYDELAGYYYCKIHGHRIRDAYKYLNCEDHEKKDGGKK